MPDAASAHDETWRAILTLIEQEEGFSCIACDAMGRTNGMHPSVRPMWTGARMAGRAVTAQPEGDDLSAVFRAIDHATPGDVIVVASMDGEARAMWGENASRFAMQRGAIGAILGVPCRDVAAHERLAFPVFAVGATPQAGYFRHGGSVDVPVTVGGTLVHPGDYVIGDENGVVVIPPDLLTEVLEGAPRILEQDRVTQAAILEGKSIPLR